MADVCDDCGRPVTVCGPEEDWTECNRLAATRQLREALARADRAEATVERLLDVADVEAWRCAFEYRRAAEDGYARDRLNDYWDDARCAVGLAQRLREAAQPQPTAAKAGP